MQTAAQYTKFTEVRKQAEVFLKVNIEYREVMEESNSYMLNGHHPQKGRYKENAEILRKFEGMVFYDDLQLKPGNGLLQGPG